MNSQFTGVLQVHHDPIEAISTFPNAKHTLPQPARRIPSIRRVAAAGIVPYP